MADRANMAKTKFLANMSHELRTPLNAIIGFSELIKNQLVGPIENPKYLEFADDILLSGRHLLNLVNDLLEMSRSEAGVHKLNLAETDLNRVVNECVQIVQSQVRDAKVELVTDYEPEPEKLSQVMIDEIKLKQVILNLLSNAVKFTPEGGRVTILTRSLTSHETYIIQVSDSGIGIEMKDVERVFEVFEQVSGDYDKDSEGAGLGLPLSKRLVELHGGTIELVSRKGTGTVVTVEMPESPKIGEPGANDNEERTA